MSGTSRGCGTDRVTISGLGFRPLGVRCVFLPSSDPSPLLEGGTPGPSSPRGMTRSGVFPTEIRRTSPIGTLHVFNSCQVRNNGAFRNPPDKIYRDKSTAIVVYPTLIKVVCPTSVRLGS